MNATGWRWSTAVSLTVLGTAVALSAQGGRADLDGVWILAGNAKIAKAGVPNDVEQEQIVHVHKKTERAYNNGKRKNSVGLLLLCYHLILKL